MPYSIPLWTIFTKCPAPGGPQWRYPCSAELLTFSRPGVRGAESTGGASVAKNRIQVPDDLSLTADHLAISPLQPRDAPARSDVDIVNSLGCQLLGPANVVAIVGITTVDENIVLRESRGHLLDHLVDDGGGDHQPDGARLLQLGDEVVERRRPGRALLDEFLDHLGRQIIDGTLVASTHETTHHIGAHSSQPNHCELHSQAPF